MGGSDLSAVTGRLARFVAVGLSLAPVVGCSTSSSVEVPDPPREFRGMWVATVANIDWPSRPGLRSDEQRQEARAILDRAVDLGINAIVLQVRPSCDALYRSSLEPWSAYLSGAEGQPPAPIYDPLEDWIAEAHARGLELHAWFNPFRARHPSRRGGDAVDSVSARNPSWVLDLGASGYRWLDPGLVAVRDHSLAVIRDVVTRYDIDGVHLDDYFYPYPEYHQGTEFPDDASYAAYRERGGELPRSEWRRSCVDDFVERLYDSVKELRPDVKVGISPFGIWRPGHPRSIQGLDAYAVLYADSRRWFREGWVDYLSPQLYWPIAQIPQSFPVLLDWWVRENARGRHLWPGLSAGRVRSHGWPARELVDQVQVTRGAVSEAPGQVWFSAAALTEERADREGTKVVALLRDGPYAQPAWVPATPWLDDEAPDRPRVTETRAGSTRRFLVEAASDPIPFSYVLSWCDGKDRWNHRVLPIPRRGDPIVFEARTAPDSGFRLAVRAIDRAGNLSEPWIGEGLRLAEIEATP